jgi:hypothetical protein
VYNGKSGGEFIYFKREKEGEHDVLYLVISLDGPRIVIRKQ